MHRTVSDLSRWFAGSALVIAALGAPGLDAAAQSRSAPAAQSRRAPAADQGVRIISSEIAISREQAELKLELSNGRNLTLSTVTSPNRGVVQSSTSGTPENAVQILSLGVARGDELDRSWRQLLNEAMDASSEDLAGLLAGWEAPERGKQLDELLDLALAGSEFPVAAPNAPANVGPPELGDSLSKLREKISRLEEQLAEQHDVTFEAFERRGRDWFSPLRHVGRGVAGVLSTLVAFAVLFGMGFATVFFGGRKYLEGVADAARHATTRSFFVGVAASFLVIPAFVLGIVVLAVSIIGIPALLVWIPAFPLAVVLSSLLGYLGVAHAAGEAMAERRFYGGDWFSRANSYYYLLTGLGLLLALFIAGHVVEMAGPWLGFIHGILMFLGVVLTWAAATTGFGAVLITRAGSRPLAGARASESETFSDAATV